MPTQDGGTTAKSRAPKRSGNSKPSRRKSPVVISPEEIAQLAYLKYLARNCQDGYDQQDWLEAEQELMGRRSGEVLSATG